MRHKASAQLTSILYSDLQVGNALKIPGVDRPVRVEALAAAALNGIEDSSVQGILRWEAMERVAAL